MVNPQLRAVVYGAQYALIRLTLMGAEQWWNLGNITLVRA